MYERKAADFQRPNVWIRESLSPIQAGEVAITARLLVDSPGRRGGCWMTASDTELVGGCKYIRAHADAGWSPSLHREHNMLTLALGSLGAGDCAV